MAKFIEITDIDGVTFRVNVDHIVSYATYEENTVISLVNIEKIQTSLTMQEITLLITF